MLTPHISVAFVRPRANAASEDTGTHAKRVVASGDKNVRFLDKKCTFSPQNIMSIHPGHSPCRQADTRQAQEGMHQGIA